ncbi:Proline dehydrogenase / Delta-1-pyrroline-5-carboxylate dehydrogenase [hydrothermal vent metagenome]|uniref:L-glutamate gamma-semialdehyde dehydrogenase n=1 Tax=hydrothermal vent metagenome TaxID=652676 RepID=A0A3B0Z8G7_9ZZZZ
MDEAKCVTQLLQRIQLDDKTRERIKQRAMALVNQIRSQGLSTGGIEAFLSEYDLSSSEGIVLMCIAEALLRIPDDATANKLIQDKLSKGDWQTHLGESPSLFVNASTWGLMLTGQVISLHGEPPSSANEWLKKLIARSGEPVVRLAMKQAMRILGYQFVMGQTIEAAISRSKNKENTPYLHSFDMLGEAALTADDVIYYFNAYQHAIKTLSLSTDNTKTLYQQASISIKLSALHPRYQVTQQQRVLDELMPRLRSLIQEAKAANITLIIDAEESGRLELSLELFERLFGEAEFTNWPGLGLAIQAYQKRAFPVIKKLISLAKKHGKCIPIRLVKGAYWDTEIKQAQEQGLSNYPVFTRKASTDTSYIACAKHLLKEQDCIYPQFATHNAHTIATIIEIAGENSRYEFQRLHGMGASLYNIILSDASLNCVCRTYAPVGEHQALLPYLVRRLLENGANTSFINRITDEKIAIENIIADPVKKTEATAILPHPDIPLPAHIFGHERTNSKGLNLEDRRTAEKLQKQIQQPFTSIQEKNQNSEHLELCLQQAHQHYQKWDSLGTAKRADILDRIADLFEKDRVALMRLCVHEAKKTIPDALGEVREAIDFCRYYAALARSQHSEHGLPGPTGESNTLLLHGRGVFACISPWNFPLAIFMGQIAAALVTGNAVLAKPASQTPLIAAYAVRLAHEAGVPSEILHVITDSGSVIGPRLAADFRIAGIAFTGSNDTAKTINRTLASRPGSIVPLIAETGGMNAMIVDSSALADQVVNDVIHSAFNSAGQRCSALRVLFLQQETAPKLIDMLCGAMDELVIGDPQCLNTDIGPVIDEQAKAKLREHTQRMKSSAKLIKVLSLPTTLKKGAYFPPHLYELDNLSLLKEEVFGPVLHIIRYKSEQLDDVISSINQTGFGLTLGIHSRIDYFANYIKERVHVGNIYINRNIIGAVVGVQPFGGEGLSGTGPKAGGPHYLSRFVTERTVTTNTTALGGNAGLLSLSDH